MSLKSEHAEIKRMGGKPQPNSGRGKHKKGDAILGPFCVDVKEYSESYSLSKSGWAKTATDAFRAGQLEPCQNVILGTEQRLRLWVVGDAMFHQMKEAWEEKYGQD